MAALARPRLRAAMTRSGRAAVAGIVLVALAFMAGACGGPHRVDENDTLRSAAVVVASFDFAESELVAEIYAQALEDEGIKVRRELGLGPRELVVPAFRQGYVDVVPEYLGTALRAATPDTTADLSDPAAVSDALRDVVARWDASILEPAPAQNQNGIVVTSETADRYGLEAVSDLDGRTGSMVLGGPRECAVRPYCLQGLSDRYGLRFAEFLPLTRAQHVAQALEEGIIDVGVLFTTDGVLAAGDLILLADDRRLQPVENLVPLVQRDALRGEQGRRLATVLDSVSARLTTENLRVLNWRVTIAGNEPDVEAHGWLVRHGLVERS